MNPREILFCGELCQNIYDTAEGYTDVQDLRFGVRGLDDTVYVVFRGTANLVNGIRDLRIWPPKLLDGFFTHRGFALAVNELDIDRQDLFEMRVVFTGHSLGGAIAALFANRYGFESITFGCPQMHFRLLPVPKINHTRIVCDDDPVPNLRIISGKHTCEPALILRDSDSQIIDVKDHKMTVYNDRLRQWAKELNL